MGYNRPPLFVSFIRKGEENCNGRKSLAEEVIRKRNGKDRGAKCKAWFKLATYKRHNGIRKVTQTFMFYVNSVNNTTEQHYDKNITT